MTKQKQIPNFKDFIKKSEVFKVLQMLEDSGFEAYIVGGAVRDIMLDKQPFDFDIATNARPKEIKRIFPRHLTQGERFGTIKVLVENNQKFEITTYRSEDVYSDSRHPDFVKYAKTLTEDSLRRDFTINAIYADKEGFIFDPQSGLHDIDANLIKTVGKPIERFAEDSLRVLRCFRFLSQLGFSLDPKTKIAALENWKSLNQVSPNRKYMELKKMVQGQFFYDLLPILIQEELLNDLVPSADLLPHLSYLQHRVQRVKALELSFVFFILDLSLLQNNLELYLQGWKHLLPFSRDENSKLDNGLYLLQVLGSKSFQEKNNFVGYSLRVGLNFLDLKNLKLFISENLLSKIGLVEEKKKTILKCLNSLEVVPETKIKATDLMALGVPAGPKIRKSLDFAYELQLQSPRLGRKEILTELELRGHL